MDQPDTGAPKTGDHHQPVVITVDIAEVDYWTVPQLRLLLRQATDSCPWVIVDMSSVTFLDTAGLGALVGARRAASSRGGDLLLAGCTSAITFLLKMTGIDRVINCYAGVEEAREALIERNR